MLHNLAVWLFLVCLIVGLSQVGADEADPTDVAVPISELRELASKVESQIGMLNGLIDTQDEELVSIQERMDLTRDLARKDALQALEIKLTRSLDKLESVRSDLMARLELLKSRLEEAEAR